MGFRCAAYCRWSVATAVETTVVFLPAGHGIPTILAMTGLTLKFLGDIEVVRGGERLDLPLSRKTRALLAYLALNRRAFRREHPCELLWEIPDDPRGSLRWM